MTTSFDFTIVGSGSVAWVSAIFLAKHAPGASIGLVSQLPRHYSATAAAGAMHAVFGEIENSIFTSAEEKRFFEIGFAARSLWHKLFQETGLGSAITARDTIVYLQNNPSPFELDNYRSVQEACVHYQCITQLSNEKVSELFSDAHRAPAEALIIKDEFSFCTELLLEGLHELIESTNNITLIPEECVTICPCDNSTFNLSLSSGDVLNSRKVLVAAGSQSGKILDKFPMQPMLQSVGAAVVLDNLEEAHFSHYVYRTVNRGGAQCGIHVVPRSKGLYLGAGSYVDVPELLPAYRTDTIRYLIESTEQELLGRKNIYKSTMSCLLGSRPRSLDSYPLIGPFNDHPNLLVATATNRVGLTWAPAIAQYMLHLFEVTTHDAYTETYQHFKGWEPDRNLIPFADNASALDYYVKTRTSNEIEHGIADSDPALQAKRIRAYGSTLQAQVNKTLGLDSGYTIHPDSWSSCAKLATSIPTP